MPLRWGIVTAAKICNDFVNAFNSFPDVGDQTITAVAARRPGAAEAFANTHNIPKVFHSYENLAVSKDVDVVYIGALSPDHYALTKLFLENGKHVLCEKPLCMNYKQAKSLVDLAQKKMLFFMEGVWSRFTPAYVEMEKEIKSGKLGDIQFVEANFGICTQGVERMWSKEMGGSALLDIGVYALQLALFAFKEDPAKVTAVGELSEGGVDVAETIILEYSGGRKAVFNLNIKTQYWNRGTIVGTKGRATFEAPFHCPTKMIHVDGRVQEFALHPTSLPYYFVNSNLLVYEALEVARCIKAGLTESPRLTQKESLLLAKIQDTVRKQIGLHFDADDHEYP